MLGEREQEWDAYQDPLAGTAPLPGVILVDEAPRRGACLTSVPTDVWADETPQARPERNPEAQFMKKMFQVVGTKKANQPQEALSLLEEGRREGIKTKQVYLMVIQVSRDTLLLPNGSFS